MGRRNPLADDIQDQLDADWEAQAVCYDMTEDEIQDCCTSWMVVLVHRDGDCKTCLGDSKEEACSRAKRVAELHKVYVASFLPQPAGTIPTFEAKKLAEGITWRAP